MLRQRRLKLSHRASLLVLATTCNCALLDLSGIVYRLRILRNSPISGNVALRSRIIR
jgi:hypothetical protein